MLKDFIYNGLQFQFEEGAQPDGAVEVGQKNTKAVEPPVTKEAPKPANKARKAANK